MTKIHETMKLSALLLSALAMITLVACGTQAGVTSGMTKDERKAYVANQVVSNLDQQHYTIEVDAMKSLRGSLRMLNDRYELTVKADTVVSYLPYFGEVYKAYPYMQQIGLNFTGKIYDYVASMVKQGQFRISFKTKTEEDTYVYNIDVFDNGKSDISVYGQFRDGIFFSGQMKITY